MSQMMSIPISTANSGPGSREFKPKSRFGPVAIILLVALHVLLVLGFMAGLHNKPMAIAKRVMTAAVIQEVKLPPPPPPPPPPKVQKIQQPKPSTPPPAYVPPPEVAPPVTATPPITAVQSVQPVAPPPPAPPAPVPAKPAVVSIGVVCPKQVTPEVPSKAVDEGIGGTVKVEVRIRGGKVVDVRFLSGPKLFYSAVRTALSQYQCNTAGEEEVVATQDFAFKIE